MKISRKQLRRLIETTIKPSIPNVPSEELLSRIDNFARDPEMQADADSFAGSFGYPEDRSYVKDLKTYDVAGREIFTDVYLKPYGDDEDEVTIVIPMDLVDNIIEAHENVTAEEGNMHSSGYAIPYDQLRDAGIDIYRHIHDQLDGRYGRDNFDIYDYGLGRGYRSEGFNKAMEKFGEVY
jgi:hypothetical protein